MAKSKTRTIRRVQREARAAALPPEPVAALDTLVYHAELGGITTLRDGRKLRWENHTYTVPASSARDLVQLGGCHYLATPAAAAARYGLLEDEVQVAIASGDVTSTEHEGTVYVVLDRESVRAMRIAGRLPAADHADTTDQEN